VPTILKKFVLKEAILEAAILKLSWQLRCVYVTSFHPTRNWREGKKRATDLASFTRSAKSIFTKQLSTSLSSMLSFQSLEPVWLKIIWRKSSHYPEWQLKGLSEAIWTVSLGQNEVTKMWPDC